MNPIQLFVLLLFLAGAVIPALNIIKMYRIKRFLRKAMVTDGLVIRKDRRTGARGLRFYILPFIYQANGQPFTGSTVMTAKTMSQVIQCPSCGWPLTRLLLKRILAEDSVPC
jgi:hypothetical protein